MTFGRRGWRGNSAGHSMAARGIRLYAKKSSSGPLMQPLFYAQRSEQDAPLQDVRDDVRGGATFADLKKKYPKADEDSLMKKGRESIDSLNGNSLMSDLSSPAYGVDRLSQLRPETQEKILLVIRDPQLRSFLPQPKVEALERRLQH